MPGSGAATSSRPEPARAAADAPAGPRAFGLVNWRGLAALYRREVKRYLSEWPETLGGAAVSALKQWRLTRLAHHYLKWRRLGEPRCRFDVVAVTVEDAGDFSLRHLRGAFEAAER